MIEDIKKDLQPNAADVAYHATKAIVNLFPAIGGTAAEAISMILSEPLSARRDMWLIKIYEGLKDLENKVKGFTIEQLMGNQSFQTFLYNSSKAAIATHEEEKLAALKNAVFNSAISDSFDDNIKTIFLNRIEILSVLHLQYLKGVGEKRDSIPNINAPSELKKQIFRDLESYGFIEKGYGIVAGISAGRITWLGERFLNFIRFDFHKP